MKKIPQMYPWTRKSSTFASRSRNFKKDFSTLGDRVFFSQFGSYLWKKLIGSSWTFHYKCVLLRKISLNLESNPDPESGSVYKLRIDRDLICLGGGMSSNHARGRICGPILYHLTKFQHIRVMHYLRIFI